MENFFIDNEHNYEENCVNCKKNFWGRKDSFLCEECKIAGREWFYNLTPEEQEAHRKKILELITSK